MMDKIIEFFNSISDTLFVTIIGIMLMAFAKSITKIFKMGAMFKSEFATRQEQREFEEEIRRDMRGYASQIQQTVLTSTLRITEEKLKDIDEIRKSAIEIKALKLQIDNELKMINEKYDEVKAVGDEVRSLSQKVQRLEYGEANSMQRRTEN